MPDDPRPSSELASFGEELRREREIRGISLKEIADATKISKRFLEAIERNDHRTLPAPVFTRGFVREYARYLGLNVDELVTRYNYGAAGDDRIEKSAHLERLVELQTTGREPLPKKGIPPPYARIDRNVYIFRIDNRPNAAGQGARPHSETCSHHARRYTADASGHRRHRRFLGNSGCRRQDCDQR
jgi:transcriptional regulator with XRE-family HTH domain